MKRSQRKTRCRLFTLSRAEAIAAEIVIQAAHSTLITVRLAPATPSLPRHLQVIHATGDKVDNGINSYSRKDDYCSSATDDDEETGHEDGITDGNCERQLGKASEGESMHSSHRFVC